MNYFNSNLDAFIDAYRKILNECIEFNGFSVKDDPVRPLVLLANNFSDMDERAISYAYPVTINRNGEHVKTTAEITVKGEVDFL